MSRTPPVVIGWSPLVTWVGARASQPEGNGGCRGLNVTITGVLDRTGCGLVLSSRLHDALDVCLDDVMLVRLADVAGGGGEQPAVKLSSDHEE